MVSKACDVDLVSDKKKMTQITVVTPSKLLTSNGLLHLNRSTWKELGCP